MTGSAAKCWTLVHDPGGYVYIGGGPGGGWARDFRSIEGSADDGKRFVEVNGVNELRGTFHWECWPR